MVYAGKHARHSSARDTGDHQGTRAPGDGCTVPPQAGEAALPLDVTPAALEVEEFLHGDDDRQRHMQHLLGSIYVHSPIRLQSPIIIDAAQRSRARSEDAPSRAAPRAAAPPEDDAPRDDAAQDDDLQEDTVILVAVKRPPSEQEPPESQPPTDPPPVEPVEPPPVNVTAQSLEDEDSLDGNDRQEHMRRLVGSIYLRPSLNRPESPGSAESPDNPQRARSRDGAPCQKLGPGPLR